MRKHPAGNTEDPAYLDFYVNRYGKRFAGLRIFEILALHWSEWDSKKCHDNKPVVTPYDKNVIEEFLQFANKHSMFVFWTDNKWHNPYERYHNHPECNTWLPIQAVRSDAIMLAAKYPNVMYLGFANNEGIRIHADGYYPRNYRLGNWHTRLQGIANLKGTALSNQTWITDYHRLLFNETLPPEEFAIWICDAFNRHNVSLVQLEPFWYMFKWDSQVLLDRQTAKDLADTNWSDAGKPTRNLRIVAELLGIDLSGL